MPPTLIQILFGDAAPAALGLASARLLLWSDAFDLWLDWRRTSYGADVYYKSLLAWRRFLQERRQMPWEIAQSDVEAHAAWMLDSEYASSKINDVIGDIANFYRWCGEHRIDPECPADFNPAEAVPRLKVRRYARTVLLSRKEISSLLAYLRSDSSPLGRRDYALFLARLRLGASLKNLLALQWSQVVHDPDGDCIRWSGGISSPLPADVWDAIQGSLSAAGRLPSMQPESYIFAPLANPLKEGPHDIPSAWAEGVCLSREAARFSLKRYGRRLGIPTEKLTLRALHRTATRLRLDEGYTMGQMKAFLVSTEKPHRIGSRLRRLPSLPSESDDVAEPAASIQPPLPSRSLHRIQSADVHVHGFAARSHPLQAVAAVIAEDIEGIDEELAGLRSLARSLLDPPRAMRKAANAADWVDAYTLAASRLALMIKTDEKLSQPPEDPDRADWVRRYLRMLDNLAEHIGEPPFSPEILAEVYGSGSDLELTDRRLAEEIAATRYVLRNTLALASSALKPAAYLRLVDVYGQGCVRLVRLLKAASRDQDRLVAYLQEYNRQMIKEASHSILVEKGFIEESEIDPDPDEPFSGL